MNRRGNDEDLLARFRAGDSGACRQVEGWAKQVIRSRHFYFSPGDQEDLVQETLMQTWFAVSKPTFNLRESLRGLVRKVAASRCIDRWRSMHPMLELDHALRDPKASPYEIVERRNERLLLRWVLRSLKTECKQIITLHFIRGLGYAEIAAQLDRAESTMRVRMFNCMKEIRTRLEQCQDPFLPQRLKSRALAAPAGDMVKKARARP